MNRTAVWLLAILSLLAAGCSTSYKEKPLPYKAPESQKNAVTVGGAVIAARAYSDPKEAKEVFGFDIIEAGMLPVQVVIDNRSDRKIEINGDQTFLEDEKGNLWPILSRRVAYDRATKNVRTQEAVKEGAAKGVLGAAAGSLIGAAVGIVTGEDMGRSIGKGAAVGAAAGAVLGGAGGYASGDAKRSITTDLREKSLENKPVAPKSLGYGVLFFPAEAVSGKKLRLQLVSPDGGAVHVVEISL